MSDKCFACDRPLGQNPRLVDTRDDQKVYVGSECAKLVDEAGEAGYQPPKGGPRLYPLREEGRCTLNGRPDFAGFAKALRHEAHWEQQIKRPDRTGQLTTDVKQLLDLAAQVERIGKAQGYL
jgi:hypothetical protein